MQFRQGQITYAQTEFLYSFSKLLGHGERVFSESICGILFKCHHMEEYELHLHNTNPEKRQVHKGLILLPNKFSEKCIQSN